MIVRAEMRMADQIDKGQASGDVTIQGQHAAHVQGSDMTALGLDRRRVAEWRTQMPTSEASPASEGFRAGLKLPSGGLATTAHCTQADDACAEEREGGGFGDGGGRFSQREYPYPTRLRWQE